MPKNLHVRPCDARVLANRKRGSKQVAFRILKDWFKHAPTAFATELLPRGKCECFFEEEYEEGERLQVAPNMGACGSPPLLSSPPQSMTDPGEEERKRKRWADENEEEEGRQEGLKAEKEEEKEEERAEEVKGVKETRGRGGD